MPYYKVLVGEHIQNDPTGKERRYKVGEVFENNGEMVQLSSVGNAPKFQRVSEDELSPTMKRSLQHTSPRKAEAELQKAGLKALPAGMTQDDVQEVLDQPDDLDKAPESEAEKTALQMRQGKPLPPEGIQDVPGRGVAPGPVSVTDTSNKPPVLGARDASMQQGVNQQEEQSTSDWSDEDLNSLTKAELIALAEEEEIEVNRSANKDELIRQIKAGKK